MFSFLLLYCAALYSVVRAGKPPRETYCAATNLDRLADFPPQPTKGPRIELARRELERRGLHSVCGYFQDDEQDACSAGQYCAYITGYWGCCGVNAAGSFTSCAIDTACVDYSSYSIACPSGICGAQTGHCQADHPYCAPALLEGTYSDGSVWTSTSYGCVQTPTVFVLATSPPSGSTTPTTSSQVPQTPSATSFSVSTEPTSTTFTSDIVTSSDGQPPTTIASTGVTSTSVGVISSSATIELPTASAGPETSTTVVIVPPPTGGSSTESGSSTTATAQPGNQGATPSTSHSNTGAIAGGVVGGVLGLALLTFLGWFLWKKKKNRAYEDTPEVAQYAYYPE